MTSLIATTLETIGRLMIFCFSSKMKKVLGLFIFSFSLLSLKSVAQTTIFLESMGGGGSNGNSIATWESNNFFDNNALTYSGTGDVRNTTVSTGYAGASGTWNIMQNASGETFIIDGIDASSYSSIALSFGIRKGTNASNGSTMVVEYSTTGTGGSYTTISWPALPTGTGTAIWYLRTSTSLIPSNVTTIRFRTTDGVEFRIDDVHLQGVVSAGCTAPTRTRSRCGFTTTCATTSMPSGSTRCACIRVPITNAPT